MSAAQEIHQAFKEWLGAMPMLPDPETIPDAEWPDVAMAISAAAIVTRETGEKLCAIALDTVQLATVIDFGRTCWALEWEARLQQSSE